MAELKECARLVEGVAEQLDARCRTWKETLDRAYKDGKYNQNTGLWKIDECKASRARYTLDAYRDALSMVDTLGQQIDELNRRPSPSTAPLTIDELRKMDGEPVWTVPLDGSGIGEWTIITIGAQTEMLKALSPDTAYNECNYAKAWLAYRRKPEEDAK